VVCVVCSEEFACSARFHEETRSAEVVVVCVLLSSRVSRLPFVSVVQFLRFLRVRSDNVVVGADILNISLTKFACCAEEGTMEHQDTCVKMGIQDVIELLPDLLCKIVPATRTFLLRLTSKTMRTAVENAKLDVVVVAKSGIKFHNGAGLQDKLNSLNAWCRVILLKLYDCQLGADGAREIAAVLRENSTLHTLNLDGNGVGADGAREIAAVLRENTTLHTLNLDGNGVGADGAREIAAVLRENSTLHTLTLSSYSVGVCQGGDITSELYYNGVGADGAREIAAVLRVNSTLQTLDLHYNNVRDDGAREIAAVLRVNSTLQTLNLGFNGVGADGAREIRQSWGNRRGCLKV
jgi:hypothetical protein